MQTCNVRWLISKVSRGTIQRDDAGDTRRSMLGGRLLLEEIYPTPAEFEGTTRQTLINSSGSNPAAAHARDAAV
uniref:Uncharacterized protein n=1 Tax=Hyaloperonospora arabidopsidis (strain Emoy2) TaxID=559515 RepID=M4BG50_HYAAE